MIGSFTRTERSLISLSSADQWDSPSDWLLSGVCRIESQGKEQAEFTSRAKLARYGPPVGW